MAMENPPCIVGFPIQAKPPFSSGISYHVISYHIIIISYHIIFIMNGGYYEGFPCFFPII